MVKHSLSVIVLIMLLILPSSLAAQVRINGGGAQATRPFPRSERVATIEMVAAVGSRARISPNGTQVCYDQIDYSEGHYQIYVADIDFENRRLLTGRLPNIPRVRTQGACRWHPNGSYIVWGQEVQTHYLDNVPSTADAGVGLFAQLYSINLSTNQVSVLTSTPVKLTAGDGIVAAANFNAVFSPDGTRIFWTQLYNNTCTPDPSCWRIRCADVVIGGGTLTIANEATCYTPADVNDYVVLMSVLTSPERFFIASNASGQTFQGMDLYLYDTGSMALTQLTNTPNDWEEGSAITPGGRVIFMSDRDGLHGVGAGSANEREYYVIDSLGAGNAAERITFFNNTGAPESGPRRRNTAIVDVAPDGTYALGTIGEDYGTIETPLIILGIVKITFTSAL